MLDIESIFYPKSIAIVGASNNPNTLGTKNFLQPFLDFGYPGRLYPVNPGYSEIMGLKAYASVRDIPEPVDYVVCVISASQTPQLMHDCVAAGVKVVALYTAGFSETGEEEGIRLEKELLEIARSGGIRVLGPNCLGIQTPGARVIYETESLVRSGNVSFCSQSGGNTKDLIAIGTARGIYFGKVVSYGNAIDLNESDFIEYFSRDEDTAIIASYIEGIKQPQRFARVLGDAARIKPVIVLKGGQTEAGRGAVASHTGSLTGSKEVWDALCRQKGAIQAANLDEMADIILAFAYLKPPAGRRVAIIGIGGGVSVQAADDCENANLVVPPFPQEIRQELRKFNPKEGTSIRNPLDASQNTYGDPALISRALEIVSGCDDIDTVLMMLSSRHATVRIGVDTWLRQVETVIELGKRIEKPLAIILPPATTPEGSSLLFKVQKQFSDAGFPAYPSVSRASQAINRLIGYHESRYS